MNRPLAFACALLLTLVSVTSACLAATPTDWISFSVDPERGDSGRLHARFSDDWRSHGDSNWSTDFPVSELAGLDLASFHAPGTRPLRFSITREAGRLDCAGDGGNHHLAGNCSFTANPAYTAALVNHGIGAPTREQAFGLMAVNARREVVDALAAAHYATPTVDDLMSLAALGVDARYVTEMARAGYRPNAIHSLVEFKALDITPEWIAGFARVGYANVPGDGLVQLRALGITPDFIAGFQRIGYRNLPVETLVQLKALDISPDFVRWAVGAQSAMPPVDELVQLKLFGRKR